MTDRAAAAQQLWDRLIVVAEAVQGDDWRRPTPCPLWSVHDLVAHLSAIQLLFDGGPDVAPPDDWQPPADMAPLDVWTERGVAARRSWSPAELLAELHAARDGHVARLQATQDWDEATQGPVGPTTQAGLFAVRCFDLWVHLQDLHLALDQPVDAPDVTAAAQAGHGYVLNLVPWLFGKRAGAPEGATMRVTLGPPLDHDSVLRVVDGRARWDPGADAGSDAVTADPAGFTLLAAGRGTPQQWQQAGLLDWSGDLGSQFVERARLF